MSSNSLLGMDTERGRRADCAIAFERRSTKTMFPFSTNPSDAYTGLPALTAGTVKVHIDPNLDYIVDVANGTLVADNVGLNANIVNTAATKSGGLTISNMKLNATGIATTVTLPLRIVGIPRNEVDGTLDGTKAIVRINNSALRAGTVGV